MRCSFGIPLVAVTCPSIPDRVFTKIVGRYGLDPDVVLWNLLCQRHAHCGHEWDSNMIGTGHSPYMPNFEGHYFGMFRKPAARIISQYISVTNLDNFEMGHSQWGVCEGIQHYADALPEHATASDKFLAYANHPCTKSCQTKMLLGIPCLQNVTITPELTEKAVQRVRHGFTFVGDTDDWDNSVKILHSKFRAPRPLDAEMMNTRATTKNMETVKLYLAALEHSNWKDDPDDAVYHEVRKQMSREPVYAEDDRKSDASFKEGFSFSLQDFANVQNIPSYHSTDACAKEWPDWS